MILLGPRDTPRPTGDHDRGGQKLPKMMLVRATRLLMPSLSGPGPLPATAKR